MAAGLVPRIPDHEPARYGFLAVSILGGSLTPYVLLLVGRDEDRWTTRYLWVNRVVAAVGMGFGGVLSAAVLVLGGLVRPPLRK